MKFEIHFSFWLLLFVSLIFQRGYLLLCYLLSVLLHELAHFFYARHHNYACEKIQISAFGAVLFGEFDDTCDVMLALVGPLCNFVLVVIIVALWWIFPACYVFTTDFFVANLVLGLTNLLPCYPLDGGKALRSLLQRKHGVKKSFELTEKISMALSLCAFALFVLSFVLGESLFAFGLFACFLMLSSFAKDNNSRFYRQDSQKIFFQRGVGGMEKKILVFSKKATLSKVAKKLKNGFLFEIEVVDENMKLITKLNNVQIDGLLLKNDSSKTFEQVLDAFC